MLFPVTFAAMQKDVDVTNTNDQGTLSHPFLLMLLPHISQPMLEMMPQKERTQEGSLFVLISILSNSLVSQKQRALVEYRISESEIETIELMFCSFGKKELCMYKLQNKIFKIILTIQHLH